MKDFYTMHESPDWRIRNPLGPVEWDMALIKYPEVKICHVKPLEYEAAMRRLAEELVAHNILAHLLQNMDGGGI